MEAPSKSIRFSVSHKKVSPAERQKIEKEIIATFPNLVCTGGGTGLLEGGCSDSSYKFDFPIEKVREVYKKLGYDPTITLY